MLNCDNINQTTEYGKIKKIDAKHRQDFFFENFRQNGVLFGFGKQDFFLSFFSCSVENY